MHVIFNQDFAHYHFDHSQTSMHTLIRMYFMYYMISLHTLLPEISLYNAVAWPVLNFIFKVVTQRKFMTTDNYGQIYMDGKIFS